MHHAVFAGNVIDMIRNGRTESVDAQIDDAPLSVPRIAGGRLRHQEHGIEIDRKKCAAIRRRRSAQKAGCKDAGVVYENVATVVPREESAARASGNPPLHPPAPPVTMARLPLWGALATSFSS